MIFIDAIITPSASWVIVFCGGSTGVSIFFFNRLVIDPLSSDSSIYVDLFHASLSVDSLCLSLHSRMVVSLVNASGQYPIVEPDILFKAVLYIIRYINVITNRANTIVCVFHKYNLRLIPDDYCVIPCILFHRIHAEVCIPGVSVLIPV